MDDYRVIDVAPDLTEAQFAAILRDGKSPALAEAPEMYRALVAGGISPAVFLAFFRQESRFGTQGIAAEYQTHNPGNVRTPEIPSLFVPIVTTPRGRFAKYPDWQAGTQDWVERMKGPKYAGRGLTTVRQVLPVYAPTGDADNNPTAYINAVLASITEWTKGAPPVALPKPPVISNPSPNHGYPGDYRPEAVVWHITAGSGASALSWLTNPASNASANYVITEDGKIHELVNPEAGQQGAAWANGDVQQPNLGNALIASWVKTGTNPNRRCVSIEHAGQSSAGKGGSLTPAQVEATIALTAWLCQRFGIAPDRQHIMPHAWVNSVTRPNCPGFSEQEWNGWVARIKALVAPLPQPDPPAAGNQIIPFVHTDGRPGVTILFEGQANQPPSVNVADLGVSLPSVTTGQMLDQSVQGNVFGGWKVRV